MNLSDFKRPSAYNAYRFLRTLGWTRRRSARWVIHTIECAAWRRKGT